MTTPTRAQLEAQTARITDRDLAADLLRRFDETSAQRDAAAEGPDRAALDSRLQAILAEASTAAGGGGGGRTGSHFLTTGGFALVILVAILSFAFLFYYFWELGGANFTSSESIRPLLVLTLIIAMLGFGGLLMIRAMFADFGGSTELQERFRLGREIFLVFAGIFATIIGFYFGAEDDEGAGKPTVEVAFTDGAVTAAVAGGSAPFTGIFTLKDQTGGQVLKTDKRVLSWEVADCPEGASVLVVDGRGGMAEGTLSCGADEPSDNAADPTGNEGDNATDAATNNIQ